MTVVFHESLILFCLETHEFVNINVYDHKQIYYDSFVENALDKTAHYLEEGYSCSYNLSP